MLGDEAEDVLRQHVALLRVLLDDLLVAHADEIILHLALRVDALVESLLLKLLELTRSEIRHGAQDLDDLSATNWTVALGDELIESIQTRYIKLVAGMTSSLYSDLLENVQRAI